MSEEAKGGAQGEVFDPKSKRNADKADKALRKANVKAVFGSGVGRLALFMLGACIMLLVSIGAYKLFGGKAPPPAASNSSANGAVLPGQAVPAGTDVGSEAEATMRRELYHQQATDAKQEQKPYIAPPITRSDDLPQMPQAGRPADNDLAQAQRNNQAQPMPATANAQQLDRDMQRLRETVDKIRDKEVMPQIMMALGRDDSGQKRMAFTIGSYSIPKAPQPVTQQGASPSLVTTNLAATGKAAAMPSAATPGRCTSPIFQAGDGCYGKLRFGINTDDPGKNVFATIYQCKGIERATVLGKYEESSKDVGVIFDKLAIPGRAALSIQAQAISDESDSTGLADDVDNHYFQRFVGTGIAAFISGLGKAAALPQGTTQTTGYNGTGSTTTTQSPISASRQAQIALGEVGTAAGSELKRQNESLKPTKTVNADKDIKVVFLSDVCEEKK